MAIEEAYSLEINQIIGAEIAYDLFWSGKLKDKKKFICAGDNCSAQITCANMDIPEQNLKQIPHFRMPTQVHSKECSLFQAEYQAEFFGGENSKTRGLNSIKSKQEKFNFTRPSINIENNSDKDPSIEKKILKTTKNYSEYTQTNNIKRMYSLRPLISNWIKYRKEKVTENKYITIEREISYNKLFKGIFKQNIDNYQDVNLIFYGKAFINKLDNNRGYRIQFLENFEITINEITKKIKPSFFISNKMIENYSIKNLLISRLKKIVEQKKI